MKRLINKTMLTKFALCACGVLFSAAILINIQLQSKIAMAAEEKAYLRIISENTPLYRTPVENGEIDNLYFMLPQTYFVELLDEPTSNFYHVNYQGVSGYVLKTNLQRVYATPQQPYPANITFQIEGVANAIIRATPNKDTGAYLGIIPFNATGVEYLGSISGQQAMQNLGTIWYYARYISFEQGALVGYVYSPLTTQIPVITPNIEELPVTPLYNADPIIPPELTNPSSWLLIALISIPAIFLLYMLFKPARKGKTKRTAPQNALPPPATNYPLLPPHGLNYPNNPPQPYNQLPYYKNRRQELTDDFNF